MSRQTPQTDPKVKKTMSDLMKNEPDGMEAVVGTIHHTRHNELERRDRTGTVNEVARINGYKGHIPSVVQQGSSVIVAEDTEFKELKERGYVRIGVARQSG